MEASESTSDSQPLDIIRNILFKLSIKSLVRFLSDSKEWNSLITEPSFINNHLRPSMESNKDCSLLLYDEDLNISSSYILRYNDEILGNAMTVDFLLLSTNLFYCEGLVFLYSNNTEEFVIRNLILRKFKKFPEEAVEYLSGSPI